MQITNREKLAIITQGILPDVIIEAKEKPRHTAFGSTDRKEITVEVRAFYKREHMVYMFKVNPWINDKEKVVERGIENIKHRFAKSIAEKFI